MMPPRRPVRPSPDEPQRAIIYRRVSTDEQEANGSGLDAQEAACRRYIEYRQWPVVDDVEETCSGATRVEDREHGHAVLDMLDRGDADALVVAKVDRLSRSVGDFSAVLDRAKARGWSVVALDLNLDMTTVMGRGMAQMVSVFAEMERGRIGERTKEALAIIEARGPAEGKKEIGAPRTLDPATRDRILKQRAAGLSYSEIVRRLNADHVPTARGKGPWRLSAVQWVVSQKQRPARVSPA